MVRKKTRQKLMLLYYQESSYSSWTSGEFYHEEKITSLPLNVVVVKSHVILDYQTVFDNIDDIEAQVSINLDSSAQVADGYLIPKLITVHDGTDVALVTWLPDKYDIHFFPNVRVTQTRYSSHITDIYVPMASNDLAVQIQLRDGFGGTGSNPVATGACNFWVLLECEVL